MNVENGIEYLKILHNIFGELGITFWLVFGTCLGLHRDGALIYYDEDIDIGIWPQNDYTSLFKCLEKNFVTPEYICTNNIMCMIKVGDYYRTDNSIDPYLDIIPFYEKDGNNWFIRDVWGDNVMGMKFPKVFFDSFDQICFEGLMFNIPANTDAYLDYFYGDWRTARIKKQDSINKFEVYCEV